MPALSFDENTTSVSSLCTIAAVKQALDETDVLASQVDNHLEEQLSKTASNASQRASTLHDASILTKNVFQDAEELSSLLSSATRTSESACVRIRQLDVLLTRGEAALTWANNILALRVCAEGAKTSLSANDLPSAARHVEQYLQLAPEVRSDEASAAAVSQIEQSIAELSRKVRDRASHLLQPSADLTIQTAIDAVKLFVPIGLKDEGLNLLTKYLCARVARESDADVRSLLLDVTSSPSSAVVVDEPHIVCIARLFEAVAGSVHECSVVMVELFDAHGILALIQSLQEQCDTCLERIVTRYKEEKAIDDVLRAIRSETANARELDAFLNELTLLSQRIARYFEFMRGKGALPESDSFPEVDRTLMQENVTSILTTCRLATFQKELTLQYYTIEVYFMRENARLAIKIDESNGEASEISTAVDDFFFVLRNCFQRAMAFGDTECEVLRIVLQQTSNCLVHDLLVYLKKRLRETEAALEKALGVTATTSSLPAAGYAVSYLTELAKANISIPGGVEMESSEADVAKYDFFTALNNTSVSADYATRLRSSVEKSFQGSQSLTVEERTVLATGVAQITDASRALVVAAEHGISRLSMVLLSRISNLVDESLNKASYIVSEAEYSLDSDATPAFSREVAYELESKVLSSTLENRLTEKNWDALVRQVAEWFANKMESIIFLPSGNEAHGKSFNAFGGLMVDRDVRAISAYFSGKSKRSTVRDVFGRLSQLAMVVNLERPGEMYDMWGSNAGGMTWRLSPTEVRRSLLLRTDFNPDTIRSLKL